MEKQQLIKFIAKVMEDSGFKVYKNFKTSQKTLDIYAVLPSAKEEYGVVVACKNYDEQFQVGKDVLEEMEEIKELIDASKVTIVTSSSFSPEAIQYSQEHNIKLVDRQRLIALVEKYKKEKEEREANNIPEETTNTSIPVDDGVSVTVDTPPITDPDDEEAVREFMESDRPTTSRPVSTGRGIFSGSQTRNSGNILDKYDNSNSRSSFVTPSIGNLGANTQSRSPRETPAIITSLMPLLNNTIVLIVLVTIIAYLIAKLLVITTNISTGIAGVVELLLALALSYGIILFTDRDGGQILVKGTVIFFVSLILLMLLTVAL